jgi:hypothetical protein
MFGLYVIQKVYIVGLGRCILFAFHWQCCGGSGTDEGV